MRAVQFAGYEQPLELVEREQRGPGPGEVELRVLACGVCGSDVHQAVDRVFGAKPGAVLGHEFSAEVSRVGEGVEDLREGARVAVVPIASCGRCAACQTGNPAYCDAKRLTSGGFADRAIVNAAQCIPLPDDVPDEFGALVEPLAVGLHGVAKAQMTPGSRVLVIGAGPIGMVTAWWARRLGATNVAMTAASTRKAEIALQLGADSFIAPDELTPERVADALGGAPDVVFECAGKPGLIDLGIGMIRRGGTVVGLGLTVEPDTLDTLGAMRREARIQMAGFFTVPEFRASIAALASDGETIARMITARIGLAELPDMFETLKARNPHCKVMVRVG